jgi:hypothetical protein
MTKGESIEQFAASMHLVLDLDAKHPLDSLAVLTLDVVAQFLPELLRAYIRRGRVRQTVSNVKHFQCGKGLWETFICTTRN